MKTFSLSALQFYSIPGQCTIQPNNFSLFSWPRACIVKFFSSWKSPLSLPARDHLTQKELSTITKRMEAVRDKVTSVKNEQASSLPEKHFFSYTDTSELQEICEIRNQLRLGLQSALSEKKKKSIEQLIAQSDEIEQELLHKAEKPESDDNPTTNSIMRGYKPAEYSTQGVKPLLIIGCGSNVQDEYPIDPTGFHASLGSAYPPQFQESYYPHGRPLQHLDFGTDTMDIDASREPTYVWDIRKDLRNESRQPKYQSIVFEYIPIWVFDEKSTFLNIKHLLSENGKMYILGAYRFGIGQNEGQTRKTTEKILKKNGLNYRFHHQGTEFHEKFLNNLSDELMYDDNHIKAIFGYYGISKDQYLIPAYSIKAKFWTRQGIWECTLAKTDAVKAAEIDKSPNNWMAVDAYCQPADPGMDPMVKTANT